MKISKPTLAILRNFATINDNIYFEPGSLLLTKSVANNIAAEVRIAEQFETGFGIYELNGFLGVLALFNDPELTFKDNYVTMSEGKNRVKYFGADKTILIVPKKRMSFELVGGNIDVEFELSLENMQQIIKTSGVLKVPDVVFVGNGKTLSAVVSDVTKSSSNSYTLELCESPAVCSIHFRVENLKMIPGNYKVEVSKVNIARFVNDTLVYHIALETSSTFE